MLDETGTKFLNENSKRKTVILCGIEVIFFSKECTVSSNEINK